MVNSMLNYGQHGNTDNLGACRNAKEKHEGGKNGEIVSTPETSDLFIVFLSSCLLCTCPAYAALSTRLSCLGLLFSLSW